MEFAELHKALLEPAAYPHAPVQVTSLQTHISALFFAGELVYKVKKPVDLGFLDFSTLDRRRWACGEEARLNADLAPGVYRRVAPLVAAGAEGGRVRIARADEAPGEQQIVEYAVEMVRLPAERMLDRVLEEGSLDEGVINQIVRRLSLFHADAATGKGVDEHGSPEVLRRKFGDTLSRLGTVGTVEDGAGDREVAISPGLLGHLHDWLLSELNSKRGLIRSRVRSGRIREGHGDLHAGNICLDPRDPDGSGQGGLVIYDRLEFSKPLRCLDVAAEIAFLAMDLEYHGHASVAAALTEQYAMRRKDGELAVLQPMHRCHYAAVRGMVESIRAREAEVGVDERRQAWVRARRHLDLALGYTLGPSLVVMCGLPGTGKSSAAEPIARALRAEWLRSDEVRREGPGSAAAADRYAPGEVERVYAEMARRAGQAMAAGRSVVADATYSTQARRAAMIAAAEEARAACVVVWITAPDDVVRERIEARRREGQDPSEANFSVYLAAKERFEPPAEVARGRLVTADARAYALEASRAALEALIGEG